MRLAGGGVSEAMAAEYAARLENGNDIAGHMPLLAELGAGRRVIELGVRTGNSTCAFLAGGADLWSCDIRPPDVPGWWHDLPDWHFTPGHDLSMPVLAALPAVCDVLFIDTSHSMSDTIAELSMYLPRVRRGGRALLHDTRWTEAALRTDPPSKVAQALDVFCAEHQMTWAHREGSHGLGIIAR